MVVLSHSCLFRAALLQLQSHGGGFRSWSEAGARDTENVLQLYLERLTALQVKPPRELLLLAGGMLRAGRAPGVAPR